MKVVKSFIKIGNELNTSIDRNEKQTDCNIENSGANNKKGLLKKVFTYFKK